MTAPTNEELAERLRDAEQYVQDYLPVLCAQYVARMDGKVHLEECPETAQLRKLCSYAGYSAASTADGLITMAASRAAAARLSESVPPTPPEAREVLPVDWPECQEFYDLMQAYRHAPVTDQTRTSVAYENVKTYLRRQAREIEGRAQITLRAALKRERT